MKKGMPFAGNDLQKKACKLWQESIFNNLYSSALSSHITDENNANFFVNIIKTTIHSITYSNIWLNYMLLFLHWSIKNTKNNEVKFTELKMKSF